MGLYTVDALTSYVEAGVPYTYVELTLLEPWYKAEQHPIARIPGGTLPDGSIQRWFVALKVGDPVGLLIAADNNRNNRGYYGLDATGVFNRRPDGGYSNGQLFTQRLVDSTELGNMVKGLAGGNLGDSCPYDEQPDTGGTTAPVDTDHDGLPKVETPLAGVDAGT
jgi:hypothetical protein